VVEEDTLSGVLDGLFHIAVLEDDVGSLSTKLKRDFLPTVSTVIAMIRGRTFKLLLEASSMTFRPTGVDPVNATFSIRGCDAMAFPTVGP